MLYTRLAAGGAAFEPQRNVITKATGLDGGGSVTADERGRVWVAWHAGPNTGGEAARALFVAESADDGRTFAAEIQPVADKTGACGCCGMRVCTDAAGRLHLAYRTAIGGSQRDLILASIDGARPLVSTLGTWTTPTCPMSTCAMVRAGDGIAVAWENEDGLHWTRVTRGKAAAAMQVAGKGAKHPSIAVEPTGDVLIAWAEGAGWSRGGILRWRRYAANGRPVEETSGEADLPAWSLPAAIWTDGRYCIWY